MTESVLLSKERPRDDAEPERESETPSDYYYDDSTGYRIYNPESEDDEGDDEAEED